jgi:AraC-like DNA-binding protein
MPEIHIDLLAIINLLGIVQGLFLSAVFFLNRQGNRWSNQLLGWLALLLSLTVLEIFACHTNLIVYTPFLINLTEPFDFLMGPVLYLYTLSLVRPGFKQKHLWLHFVPAVVYYGLRLPYLLQSNAFKLADVQEVYHRISGNPVPVQPIWWYPAYHFGGRTLDEFAYTSLIGYAVASFWLIRQFIQKRGETFWNPSLKPLRWLVRLMSIFTGFLLFTACISFLSADDTGDIYSATASALLFYGVSFLIIREAAVFSAASPEKKKYANSSLSEENASVSLQKLQTLMQTEKPYLNNDLTLAELAGKLHLSTHHLSQLLNEQSGKNFFDFVNEYRVAEMKQKLQEPALAHLKIEELAYRCGFNSKSVFNTVFKKFTGTTPSEYRKTLKSA